MTRLEQIVETHLEQSKTIWTTLSENNTDTKWLKKAFWTLAGAGVTFNVTLAAGLILWLINK